MVTTILEQAAAAQRAAKEQEQAAAEAQAAAQELATRLAAEAAAAEARREAPMWVVSALEARFGAPGVDLPIALGETVIDHDPGTGTTVVGIADIAGVEVAFALDGDELTTAVDLNSKRWLVWNAADLLREARRSDRMLRWDNLGEALAALEAAPNATEHSELDLVVQQWVTRLLVVSDPSYGPRLSREQVMVDSLDIDQLVAYLDTVPPRTAEMLGWRAAEELGRVPSVCEPLSKVAREVGSVTMLVAGAKNQVRRHGQRVTPAWFRV